MPNRPSVNRRNLLIGTALGAASLGVGSIPRATPGASAAQLARNETLFYSGVQWGAPTSFSPISPSASTTWPVQPRFAEIFEQLFAFNSITGENEPLLAREAVWEGTESVTVSLQDGTAWADGTPLTADDVVFTYTLPSTVDGLPFAAVEQYISAIEKVDDTTMKFTATADNVNPGMVNSFLQNVPILPMHIWEPLVQESANGGEQITAIVDMDPIASGPFKISISSPEQTVLERRDDYWGNEAIGQPAPKYVVHPIPKSNDDANLALSRGEIDWSQNFVPQIWQMWEDQELPVGTWFKEQPYHVPGQVPSLLINLSKPGLDNAAVRRALAYSINYAQIAETAMSRYSVPVNPSLIIPEGGEAAFFDADAIAETGWSYDPEQARAILEDELGATKDNDGIYVLEDGTRLGPWTATCPYGWTDWMTALELVAQGGRETGFDISTDFPESPVRMSRMQNAEFDLMLHSYSGPSPAGPWLRIYEALDSRGVPPAGETAYRNFNRYSNPEVEALLDQIPVAETPEEQKELYTQMEAYFREDVPLIPLMYRPFRFFEFNETHWTGFPTSENPYAPPQDLGAGIRIHSNIQPTGQ